MSFAPRRADSHQVSALQIEMRLCPEYGSKDEQHSPTMKFPAMGRDPNHIYSATGPINMSTKDIAMRTCVTSHDGSGSTIRYGFLPRSRLPG